MSTRTGTPTASGLAEERSQAPHVGSFGQMTRIARGFGAGFRPVRDPHLAEGTLTNETTFCRVLLSYEPEPIRVRLVARVAEVESVSADLASTLLRLQAGSAFARFMWAGEADHSLVLEAPTCCPPDTGMVAAIVEHIFRDLRGVLWDSDLTAALEKARARSCARPVPAWGED